MRRWTKTRRLAGLAAFALCALLGVALGLGGYTFWYGEGLSYFSSDPRACANCHVMNDHLDSWQKGSHHAFATCNDCHTPHDFLGKYTTKAVNGFWHSKGFTLMDFHDPIRITPRNAAILQNACLGCHEGLTHDIVEFGSAGEVGCVKCHAGVGHGPQR